MLSAKKAQRTLVRVLPPVIAAAIVVFSLSYPESGWYEELNRWMRRAPHPAAQAPSRPDPPSTPLLVTPMRPSGTDSSVSRSPLALILVSAQPGRNVGEGFAQIGVNALTPQTYRAGAILANGARLTEVHADYVLLERDGKNARLELNDANGVRQTGSAASLLTVGGVPKPGPAAVTSADTLAHYLRASPVFTGDHVRGYALYAGREQGPFFKMGLEPGDVLIEIDGVPVSDARDTLAALNSLTVGAALTVRIRRHGAVRTLSLDGGILVQAIAAGPAPLPRLTPEYAADRLPTGLTPH